MYKKITVLLLVIFMFSNVHALGNSVVVFAGDSITAGFAPSVQLPEAQRFSNLVGNAKGFTTIVNKGLNADTVSGLQARLQADVISQSPDMVVIMIGRNDVANSASPITPVITYKQKLGEIVQSLKDAGITRILLLSWPVGNHQFYAGVNSPPFLDAIAQVAAEKGVYYIDIYSMWASYKWASASTVAEYDALYSDNPGIHPSAAGHAVIAEFVNKPQFNYMFNDVAPTPTFEPTFTPTLQPTFTPTLQLTPTATLPACAPDPDLVDPDVLSEAFNQWIRSLPK